ncbi:MAG: 2'-5' RNA ligase family protein [Myxococcota bacterium]
MWVGVEKSEPLEHLRKKLVDSIATRMGIEPDRRKWMPHVTLARLDDAPESRLARFAAENSLYKSRYFDVEQLTLWSSRILTSGAQYQREAVFVLRG